jgi:hypothetical protein
MDRLENFSRLRILFADLFRPFPLESEKLSPPPDAKYFVPWAHLLHPEGGDQASQLWRLEARRPSVPVLTRFGPTDPSRSGMYDVDTECVSDAVLDLRLKLTFSARIL